MKSFEIPGMPGANVGMVNIGDIFGNNNVRKKVEKENVG